MCGVSPPTALLGESIQEVADVRIGTAASAALIHPGFADGDRNTIGPGAGSTRLRGAPAPCSERRSRSK